MPTNTDNPHSSTDTSNQLAKRDPGGAAPRQRLVGRHAPSGHIAAERGSVPPIQRTSPQQWATATINAGRFVLFCGGGEWLASDTIAEIEP
jgi:hypothetical protein